MKLKTRTGTVFAVASVLIFGAGVVAAPYIAKLNAEPVPSGWQLVGLFGTGKLETSVYIDADSIVFDGARIRIWQSTVYKTPIAWPKLEPIAKSLALVEYDCQGRTWMDIQRSSYGTTGLFIRSSVDTLFLNERRPAMPDTEGETKLEAACALAQRKKHAR